MTDAENRAGLFLDRDGTIIEDRGFLTEPDEVVFVPGVFAALRRLQEHFLLFIVTHQTGLSRGLQTSEQVERVNDHVVSELAREGIRILEVYCCPHEKEEDCLCRKPKPYFLEVAAEQYGLELSRSISIGDHPADADLGLNAGGLGLYVLTGHGAKHRSEIATGTRVFADLGAAADWILGMLG